MNKNVSLAAPAASSPIFFRCAPVPSPFILTPLLRDKTEPVPSTWISKKGNYRSVSGETFRVQLLKCGTESQENFFQDLHHIIRLQPNIKHCSSSYFKSAILWSPSFQYIKTSISQLFLQPYHEQKILRYLYDTLERNHKAIQVKVGYLDSLSNTRTEGLPWDSLGSSCRFITSFSPSEVIFKGVS